MGLFLFGVSFWVLSSIAFILIILSLESRRFGGTGATLTMIALFGLLSLTGSVSIKSLTEYITHNIGTVLLYLIGYVFIGIVWSFIKWYYHLLNYRDKHSVNGKIDKSYIPKISNNSGMVISWMTYWPISASWTIINDPFRRMYNRIFIKLELIYEKISDKVFSGE